MVRYLYNMAGNFCIPETTRFSAYSRKGNDRKAEKMECGGQTKERGVICMTTFCLMPHTDMFLISPDSYMKKPGIRKFL
jgi:hypothetical protein